MSKLKKLKAAWNYESSVARCGNCESFQEPYIYLTTDSNTKRSHPVCKRGWFSVTANGICDKYVDAAPLDLAGEAK